MKNITHFLHTFIRAIVIPFAILAALTLGGCQPGTTERQAQTPETHPLTGVIVSVQKEKRLLVVKHDAIPGKMDAMTMPFSVADSSEFSKLHKGDKISADFSIQANGAVLDNITVLKK
jgi:protein SCO1/2